MRDFRRTDNQGDQSARRYDERAVHDRLDSDDDRRSSSSSNQSDESVDYELTAKWAAFYPNEPIAVVTSVSKPPLPPHGAYTELASLVLVSCVM